MAVEQVPSSFIYYELDFLNVILLYNFRQYAMDLG